MKVPRRTLEASLPLCFMDSSSIAFSLLEAGGRGQLHKFRPVGLLEMFCGVQDILTYLTDTTQTCRRFCQNQPARMKVTAVTATGTAT